MSLSKDKRDVFFVDASRSPFLKARGKPGAFKAADLGVAAAKPLLMRQPFSPEDFDQVIVGCVSAGADEANIARVMSLRLGCGDKVTAWTVQRNCASGLQSIDSAMQAIARGDSDLVLAGGVEAMSHAPLLWKEEMVVWLADWNRAKGIMGKLKALASLKLRHLAPVIGILRGLRDPVTGLSMGQTAEKIAFRFGIGRQQMDEFAVASHLRLNAAQEAGYFDEITAVYDNKGNAYEHDDGVRPDSSVEKLARLRPAFDKKYGNVTPGNSAQITDGAAWVILASADAIKKYNLPIIGKAVDVEWAGVDPTEMGLGPVHAVIPLLQRNKLAIDDIDYWELNEAFAGQVLGCMAAWQDPDYCKQHFNLDEAFGTVPHEKLNIDGGGISQGHPVGASGTRITLHLLHILKRTNSRYGVATLCIGGGQGGAILVENKESV